LGLDIVAADHSDGRPRYCKYRLDDESAGKQLPICTLARHFAGGHASANFRVEPAACETCARYPLPDGPRLNPVVASLVLSATRHISGAIPLPTRERLAMHGVARFAERWLLTSGGADVRRALKSDDPIGGARPDERLVRARDRRSDVPGAEPLRKLRIGLVGPHSRFGLGHQNRDLAVNLDIDRWLVPLGGPGDSPPVGLRCRTDVISRDLSDLELEAWLDGLDVVLFVESPFFPALTDVARQMGVCVVCVPNWEWLHPGLEWLDGVDVMLCPTRHTARLLTEWKGHFRFSWTVETMAWPVDTNHFRFRRRFVCRRFVFVNGSGGFRARPINGSLADFRRKGLEVLLSAAELAPEVSIIVYAEAKDAPAIPPSVELRHPPGDNSLLYCDGDVCVQPSHWEGLGLPLLECQAAGMPLVTTNAPPMNEHQPIAVIPAVEEAAYLTSDLCIPAARIRPEDLAGVLRSLQGRRIFCESGRARRHVLREHNWRVARPKLLQILGSATSESYERFSPAR
jgi:glycosyltransferase involved in cell wall biosynthesis